MREEEAGTAETDFSRSEASAWGREQVCAGEALGVCVPLHAFVTSQTCQDSAGVFWECFACRSLSRNGHRQ